MSVQDEHRRALQQVLRNARQAAALTQIDVAQRLSQPQSYVSKYEAGSRRLDLIELLSVCAVLGIEIGTLVATLRQEIGPQ